MDYRSLFPSLDPDTRIWVYVSDSPLSASQEADLERTVRDFGAGWSSHGRVVISDFTIIENQILILGAYVQQGEISGCGIDKSLHVLDQFAQSNEFEWVSALSVIFRDTEDRLAVLPRNAFRQLVKSGEVSESTTVMDTSITSLADVRAGRFELPAGMSWHAGVFQIPISLAQ